MLSLPRVFASFTLLMFLSLLVACGGNATTQPQPVAPAVATPDPLQATPQSVLAQEPLQGQIPDIPTVFIVTARQSKALLATFLKTTPDQLDWVNPDLPDPVTPGTLIVIPPIYRTSGETLSAIAQKTGMPEKELRAANPKIGATETLTKGIVLAVPPIYVVPEDTLVSTAAAMLQTSDDVLLSANPQLREQDKILAGTVLVVPLKREKH